MDLMTLEVSTTAKETCEIGGTMKQEKLIMLKRNASLNSTQITLSR